MWKCIFHFGSETQLNGEVASNLEFKRNNFSYSRIKPCWTRLEMAANQPTMFFFGAVAAAFMLAICFTSPSPPRPHVLRDRHFSLVIWGRFSLLCSSTLNSPGEQFWRLEKHKTILFECLIDVNAFAGLFRSLRFFAQSFVAPKTTLCKTKSGVEW